MLNPGALKAIQEDYHELMDCIEEQEAIWKAQGGDLKDDILQKLKLLEESRKSIEELYSIYFDCQEEDWDKVVEKASKAFQLTMLYEGMA